MRKVIFSLSLVLVLFIIVIFSLGLKTKKIYDTKDLIGKKISTLDLKLLNDDKIFNTAELKKNNFTLINFWASWCAPCRKEHKHLISLSKTKNLKIIGINFKDEKSKANKFLKDLGNPFSNIIIDKKGIIAIEFGGYGITETFIINKEKKIIKTYIGNLTEESLKEINLIIK